MRKGLQLLILGVFALVGCSGHSGALPSTVNGGTTAGGSGSAGVTFKADGSATEKILANVKVDPNLRVFASNVHTRAFALRGHASPSNPTDVIYHGGPTLFNAGSVNVYVNATANPAPSQWSFPGGFIGRFSLSKLNHVMDQYTGASKDNRYPYLGGLSLTDGATGTWGNTQINQIIQAAINATGNTGYRVVYHIFLVAGQQVCTTAPYPAGCYGTAYCAFHGSGDFSGTVSGHVIFTVEPWQQVTGCKAPTDTVQNDTASTLSNEMSEAFTDPDSNAWYNAAGNEIGDICKTSYGNIPLYPNFIVYNIQKEWLNSQHACAFGPTGQISEFAINMRLGYPAGITVGPDGNLWFSENDPSFQTPAIYRITAIGTIKQFGLLGPSSLPLIITAGPDGNLWFTDATPPVNKIGRMTLSGTITEFPIPAGASNPWGIAAGHDGNLWFTEQGGPSGDAIGRMRVNGTITEFPIPGSYTYPEGITTGPDANLWFTEYGTSNGKIGRITPSGTITEFPIPTIDSLPAFIASGPDGNLWFTESGDPANKIGRITPSGTITEFAIPTAHSVPQGITAGPDGNLWFAEYGKGTLSSPGKIGRITPRGSITEFPVPTASSAPYAITTGPDGNLWFTEAGGNQIGRLIP